MINVIINVAFSAICGYMFEKGNLDESGRNLRLKYENKKLQDIADEAYKAMGEANDELAKEKAALAKEKALHEETRQELKIAIEKMKASNDLILDMVSTLKKAADSNNEQPASEESIQELKKTMESKNA